MQSIHARFERSAALAQLSDTARFLDNTCVALRTLSDECAKHHISAIFFEELIDACADVAHRADYIVDEIFYANKVRAERAEQAQREERERADRTRARITAAARAARTYRAA